MATLATRLTSTGNLLVNGTFDEVSMPSGSLLFDGTGDFIKTPTNSAFDLSSGNFTIEFFAYFTSVAANQHILTNYNNPGGNLGLAIYTTSIGTLNYYLSSTGSTIDIASGSLMGNISTGIWYHVALVRNGSTFTPYLNGVAGTTATSASAVYDNSFFNIGGDGYTNINQSFFGYLTNFRYVKGTALYTANFTPSIGVLESTANTSLLLNVLNSADYIKDNSSNKFNLTRNGNTSYNSLTPFNRGAHSVSNDTVFTRLSDEVSLAAGSVYFDGTGDNLSVSNISSLSLGSGNFTIDFWINAPTQSGNACIIETRSAAGAAGYFVGLVNDNRIQFNYITNYLSVGTVVPNAWNHVSIVRSGSTIRTFINGVAESGTFTSSATITANSASIGQKVYSVSTLINLTGYLSNLRVINGSALYSANFTPQQTILDSTSDTTYLLNVLNSTNALKDSSKNQNITIAGGDAAWNANGPFNQGVTGLVERRLSNATLVKNQFDEFTGAPVVDSSLVLWLDAANPASYPETGTTWTDLSGRGYNSALTNGPTFNSTLSGGVFLFDGSNDYSTLTGIPDSIWQGNWTASFWVYFNTVSSSTFGSQDKTLIHHGFASTRNGLHLCQRNSRVHFGLYGDDLQGNTIVNAGVWYNLVYTLNNSTYLKQIYINSVLDTPNAGYTDVGLGAYTGTGTNTRLAGPFIFSALYFDGFIGAVSLFNRVLSSDEVAQNFNALRRRFSI